MEKNFLTDVRKLKVPNNFAKEKGISKAMVYMLIKKGVIDWISIDGYMFVVLSPKTLKYSKSNFRNG